jgi:hypothetical protein
MKRIFTLIFTSFLFCAACSESSSSVPATNCDEQAQVVTDAVFGLINTENYTITAVSLNEDCLDITISSSGCNPNNWEMGLFSTSDFSETTIPQKNLKVKLVNEEACLAVFQKTVSFSLIPYQLAGDNEITLFIEGWPTPISYTY